MIAAAPRSGSFSPASPLALTVEDFERFCKREENQDRRFELVRGEIVEMARPNLEYGAVQTRIAASFLNYANRVGKGTTFTESGVRTHREFDSIRGPDVGFFVDTVTDQFVLKSWSELPPLLTVEVRSPSDRSKDLIAKIDEYLSCGVQYVWVVELEERFILVYRRDSNPKLYNPGNSITCPELPEFAFPVASIFPIMS